AFRSGASSATAGPAAAHAIRAGSPWARSLRSVPGREVERRRDDRAAAAGRSREPNVVGDAAHAREHLGVAHRSAELDRVDLTGAVDAHVDAHAPFELVVDLEPSLVAVAE